MVALRPAFLLAVVTYTTCVLLSSCTPPKDIDYRAPDASADPDAPVPVAVEPEEGAEDVNRLKVMRITFDQHLDARSMRQRLSLRSGETGRWLVSYYDPIQMQLVAWPASPLLRQATWVLSVNQGIDGMNGSPVYPEELTWFRTGDEVTLETPFKIRSFEKEVMPIFEQHCISCHGGGGASIAGLDLASAEGVRETALNENAGGWPEWKLIEPTRPGESYLLFKLIGDDDIPGETMPRSMDENKPPPLSALEKEIILDWIASGASFFDPQ